MFKKKNKVSPEMKWGEKVTFVVDGIKDCEGFFEDLINMNHTLDVVLYRYNKVLNEDDVWKFMERKVNQKKQQLLYELKQLKKGE